VSPYVGPDDFEVDTEPHALRQRSVHGALVSILGQSVRFLVQMGAQFYLAHVVSPSAFGLIAMVAPVLRFVQLFNDMGLLQAVIQRPKISQQELSALFWINLAVSSILAIVLSATAPLVGWFYGEPRIPAIMASLCIILVLSGLSAQPMALLNRRMRFLPLALIDIASTASAAAIGIGMARLGFGYWALVAMQAANSVVLCVLAWLFSGWYPLLPARPPEIKSLLSFGGHVTAFNVLGFLSESFVKVLLGVAAGSFVLGLYDRSSILVMTPLVLVMVPFTRIAVPLLSRLLGGAERYRRSYLQILQTGLTIVTPGLLCAIIFPSWVILPLLGPAWSDATPILRWLAIGTLAYPLIGSTNWLFVSQNRADQQLLWGSIGFVAIAASCIAGLPWGAVGVARSWAICSWLVQAPVILWAATREGPVRGRDVLAACGPVVGASSITAVLLWLTISGSQLHGVYGLMVALLVSYGAQGLIMALLPGGQRFFRDTWALRSAIAGTMT
jgi:polysaccharide transporter, PST family